MYAFYQKHEYALAALFVLITQLCVLPMVTGLYPDTDNYTHARRVLDLIETGVWAETPYVHSNYPFGEILHFTRVTDVFWLFFSLPAFLFFSVKDAVFWGGQIYQTGVLILSAVALIWALKPMTPPLPRLIGLCILFLQPSVTETYILIKPDHHVLTALFAFVALGGLTHYLADRRKEHLRTAGIGAGLCLWSSVEGLLIAYTLLGGLVLLFLLNRESVKAAAYYFFYFFVSSLVFLAVNPPYEGFFFPDNGRLSFLMITTIGLTDVALIFLSALEEKKPQAGFFRKLFVLIATAAFFAALVFLLFPANVVLAPHFSPEIKEIWAENVVELQSGVKRGILFFLAVWPSLICLLTGLIVYKFCTPAQRSFLLLTLPSLIFFTAFAIVRIRYARLSSLFTPFPIVLFFALRLKPQDFSERKNGVLITVLYLSCLIFLSVNYRSVHQSLTARAAPPVSVVKPFLPQREGSILADVSLGPEVIWNLDEKVIGTPYHRNVEGIRDDVFAFYTENMNEAVELLKKHRVKAVLIYAELDGLPYFFYDPDQRYSYRIKNVNTNSLIRKLIFDKDLPCGIEEELNTPVPYLLYTVDFSKCPDEYKN